MRAFNGYVRGQNSMDLRPGMELRIENAYYETGKPKRGLTGYLGTEIVRYHLTPHAGLHLVSLQSMNNRPNDQAPVERLIGQAKQHYRYYRYYFEILFKNEKQSRGSVLLGAKSAREMTQLGAALASDPETVCGGKETHCVVFPEACSVAAEMEISVNGSKQSVVWGSMLSSVAPNPQRVKLWRIYKGRLTPVALDIQNADALRIPLLPGDSVEWK